MQALAYAPLVARPTEAEKTMQLAFRLPVSLVDDLDAEAETIAPKGIRISRTDLVKVLLREALDARKRERGAKQPKK